MQMSGKDDRPFLEEPSLDDAAPVRLAVEGKDEMDGDEAGAGVSQEQSILQRELQSYVKVPSFFSYQTYLFSARVRFAYFFLLVTALVFVCMMAFTFTVFFSVLLPEAREDHKWGLRAAFMLPFAPIVLIGGSWFCDELLDLLVDAARPSQMSDFRTRLATVIHVVFNWSACNKDGDEYTGPELSRPTLIVVDLLVPVAFEFFPLVGFVSAASEFRDSHEAIAGYFTWGLGMAGVYGAIYVITHFLTVVLARFRLAFEYFDYSTPNVQYRWSFNTPDRDSSGDEEAAANQGTMRVLNLGRYLVSDSYWARKLMSQEAETPGCCAQYVTKYKARFSWSVRFVVDLILFFLLGLLVAYNALPFALGWFFICIVMLLIGFKLREKYPALLGAAFTSILIFFTIFGGFLFIFAFAGLQGSSALSVTPPTNQTLIDDPPVLQSYNGISNNYAICQRAWAGLDVIDLAVLSNLAYAANTDTFTEKMQGAFNSTSMANWTLLREQPADEVIHFKEVYFAPSDLHVVLVRGTSNAVEIYTDAYIYSGISILQFINTFAPINNILPFRVIQRLMRAISLPDLTAEPSYMDAVNHVADLKAQGKKVVVTGHSLGGAVAGIAAARNEVPGITFSPPGLFYNEKRVGTTDEALRRNLFIVVPAKDVVPKVDHQMGAVQDIMCKKNAAACHSVDNTLCTLVEVCGDRRQRDWSTFCGPDGSL